MSTKNDLNAIYKLEFYKKKKNWKLKRDPDPEIPETDDQPQEELEEKKSTGNNNDLNKTYDIARRVHTDALLQLNNAFLEIGLEIHTNQNTLGSDSDRSWVDYMETNMDDVDQDIVWAKPELPWDQVGADYTQQGSSDSLESLTTFMQGASCAPHSSDIEVASAADEDLSHFAWCLSLKHEESMLRHLLVRATGRERGPHQLSLYDGPGAAAVKPELIIAGSFDLSDIPGKGRGRLRRPIRLGRPYFNQ